VHVPAIKDIPAHRPLGIFHFLEQIYGNQDEEIAYRDENNFSNIRHEGEVCLWSVLFCGVFISYLGKKFFLQPLKIFSAFKNIDHIKKST
jgi:hypothetical protein